MSVEKSNLLQPEKIHIAETTIVKFHIDSPFGFVTEKANGFDFTRDFKLGFNLADKLVKADFKVEIATKSGGGNVEESKGSFHFAFIYYVENLEELVLTDKSYHIELNGDLGNALASITYSTTRGVLLARLRGTSLENFVLPVIDPNNLIKQ